MGVQSTARPEPVRTCVGCRGEASKRGMMRIVRQPDGGATVDRTGRAPGRGAYLHSDLACIESARKRKAVERALKTSVTSDIWDELLRTNT
ncbi:MAG TPA: YlxR family protein [Clostridia bacterium]|nr:YlxR family protein [Clostridia bacterium]